MIRNVHLMGMDTAGHVLFKCPLTDQWRSRTEAKGLNSPPNKTDITHNESMEWWEYFSSAAKELDRLRHDI